VYRNRHYNLKSFNFNRDDDIAGGYILRYIIQL
jgi:hypothetical protein